MPTYPIASKSPIFRKFRKSLAEFVTRLISSSAELGSLYASDLIPILQAWIVPLSGSQIRSFRHTATVIALYMETALCQTAAAVDKELQVLSRQKEGERNKKAGRSKARESELDTKTKEVNTRRATLKEHLKDIFNAYVYFCYSVSRYITETSHSAYLCIDREITTRQFVQTAFTSLEYGLPSTRPTFWNLASCHT
jgi:hypothetical protein